ncbi:hypothetical protein AGLY_001612 [Aphis glycines]|uniref:Uncharacterized protein n=1 Tax=Aphis glycines TaxID=307491 RepID=A0A6G0U666_APHGL|nr:hypothetical protein AGLY_001612 [Aphis glycines]
MYILTLSSIFIILYIIRRIFNNVCHTSSKNIFSKIEELCSNSNKTKIGHMTMQMGNVKSTNLDLNLDTSATFHRNGAKFSSFRKKPTSSRSFRNRVSRSLYNSTASSSVPASMTSDSAKPSDSTTAAEQHNMISSASLPVFTSPASTPGYSSSKHPAHMPSISATPVKNKSKYCRIL